MHWRWDGACPTVSSNSRVVRLLVSLNSLADLVSPHHPPRHANPALPPLLQRVAEMAAKGQDYKKEMAKLKAARAAAKAKAAAVAAAK